MVSFYVCFLVLATHGAGAGYVRLSRTGLFKLPTPCRTEVPGDWMRSLWEKVRCDALN